MIRAVIDTNVLVSALIKPDSRLGDVLRHLEAGHFIPRLSRELLAELSETVLAPRIAVKYAITLERASALLALLSVRGEWVTIPDALREQAARWLPDPDDAHVLAAAMVEPETALVTGDKGFLTMDTVPPGVVILSVQAFLDMLRPGSDRV
jgi:putative PIN family toxin of toxin-antitoxin system